MTSVQHASFTSSWLRADAGDTLTASMSRTIELARIGLVIGLVFLHYQEFPNSTYSPFHGLDAAHHQFATFVNSFVLFAFFSVVPLLSLISGWLFFGLGGTDVAATLRRRIGHRFLSLYVPLVAWNLFYVIALLWWFGVHPDHPIFHELNLRFSEAGGLDYVNAVLGITRRPLAFQFWFVRDLFLTVLLSPLLLLLLRHAQYLGLALLGLAWLAGNDLVIFFRTDVVLFFYIGGMLRMHGARLDLPLRSTVILLTVYIALVTLRALAPILFDFVDQRPPFLAVATRAMRLVGVLACWGLFQQFADTRWGASLGARFGGLAFFLHCTHFPLLGVMKIMLWRWVPAETDAWMLLHYFASVSLTVAICLASGMALARAMPRFFAMLNGGRAGCVAGNVEPGSAAPPGLPVAAPAGPARVRHEPAAIACATRRRVAGAAPRSTRYRQAGDRPPGRAQ